MRSMNRLMIAMAMKILKCYQRPIFICKTEIQLLLCFSDIPLELACGYFQNFCEYPSFSGCELNSRRMCEL